MAGPAAAETPKKAGLVVINPSGNRTRVPVEPLPFTIGRQADNHLILRDNRASRNHARLLRDEKGDYWVEDLKSRHGVWVNGAPIHGRRRLANGDRLEFGVEDSYRLIFTLEEGELQRLLEQFPLTARSAAPGAANLAKLRALVEVARTVQSSLSPHDVLGAVVDAALTVTGAERGFLLLKKGGDLELEVARDARGLTLPASDCGLPTRAIHQALAERRELLAMNFDWRGADASGAPGADAAPAVLCVPLIHVRTGGAEETVMSSVDDTVGLIYMESRRRSSDLSAGDREILQTLAIEASTILENARLLEQERHKLKMEEELNIAREIQRSLLPRRLPSSGWFRAAGSSIPSAQVGGDYYDVREITPGVWAVVVADVSGKGVSSALLASLLQGAFLAGAEAQVEIERMMARTNRFLIERTEGEKYATVFYCTLDRGGLLRWSNAGHCPPLILHTNGEIELLHASGLPVGMLEEATFEARQTRLEPGGKLIAYTDGVSEAQNREGAFFDVRRMKDVLHAHGGSSCAMVNAALIDAVEAFTGGREQGDDITTVVIEYQPEPV